MHHRASALLALVVFGVSSAAAQSINIRYGLSASTPAATYGAAGQAGVWNSFIVTPDYARQPLVNLQGTPIAGQLYQFGCSVMLAFDMPGTPSGSDDEKLMDNMILSYNSPVDACYWVEGMMNGTYEVTIYALTPNEPSRICRTRVDNAPPAQFIGGAWPGTHQQGVTFSRFNVTTSNGVIGWHSGLYNGNIQSGMNGTQIKFLGSCPSPTLGIQPLADYIVPAGQPVNLAMTATNPAGVTGGLTYRWQKAGAANASGTAPTLAIAAATTADSGVYTGTVYNACGSASTQAVRVTVLTADMGVQGGAPGTDGVLDNNDFIAFIDGFFGGQAKADLGRQGGVPGGDGLFDNNDFVVFIDVFFGG